MKKIIILLQLAAMICLQLVAAEIPEQKNPVAEPSATMQKMWVDYDVEENGVYGMRIHVAFTTYEMKGMEARLTIYFQHDSGKPGDYLPDRNQKYRTSNDIVCVGQGFTPTYANSVYDDMQFFMPYDELDLDPGKYDLLMDPQLYFPNSGRTIAWFPFYAFEYTQYDNSRGNPGATVKSIIVKSRPVRTAGPRASFQKMWIDYNHVQDSVRGLLLHFDFITYDMKNTEAFVAVYFGMNDSTGAWLKDKNQKYQSSTGVVAVFRSILPAYDTAYYNDFRVFMPDSEMDITTPGKYALFMDARLITKQGDAITNFSRSAFDLNIPAPAKR